MVEEIDNLQDDQLMELREQAALLQAIDAAKLSTTTDMATSSESSARGDLFQPTNDSAAPKSSDFQIPPGVTIEKLNNN